MVKMSDDHSFRLYCAVLCSAMVSCSLSISFFSLVRMSVFGFVFLLVYYLFGRFWCMFICMCVVRVLVRAHALTDDNIEMRPYAPELLTKIYLHHAVSLSRHLISRMRASCQESNNF